MRKTTLLRIIAGTSSDYTGTVLRPDADLACVFQEPRLLPWRNALDNVLLPLPPGPKSIAHAMGWLERVGVGDAYDLYPAHMSGGMRQRVGVCCMDRRQLSGPNPNRHSCADSWKAADTKGQ